MNHRQQQNRSSSHGRKALTQHARPARPAALTRRGHSYSHAPSPSSAASQHASGSVGAGRSNKVGVESDEDEVDMESFLQFCATCERQIITPGASILYCSESCRRKDSQSQPTYLSLHKHSPVLGSSISYFDHHHHIIPDIIPQRCPTVLRPLSLTFFDLMISESGSPTDTTSYHLPSSSSHHLGRHDDPPAWTDTSSPKLRPHPYRRSTNLDLSALPSLIHSPSSSLGSPTCTRPLGSKTSSPPSRSRPASTHQPPDSMTTGSLKSTAGTLTSFRIAEANASHALAYEKRRPAAGVRTHSEAQGSLKQLFGSMSKT